MTIYKIRDWSEIYETHETRKLERLRWVPKPNKHDGLGFRRIVKERDRCELLAAWHLIVDVASRAPRKERGIVARDGTPLGAEDLSLMTGFPETIFKRAFTFFSDPKQGWLIASQISDDFSADKASDSEQSDGSPLSTAESTDCDKSPACPADSPGIPAESPAEEKRREEKRMEGKEAQAPVAPAPLDCEAFASKWAEYIAYRKESRMKPLKPVSVAKQWAEMATWGLDGAIASIEQTIAKGWQGLFEPKARANGKPTRKGMYDSAF